MPADLSFEEWFAELIKIATADGATDYVENTNPTDWRDAYEDGDTPEDAWRTEKTYAAQDMG